MDKRKTKLTLEEAMRHVPFYFWEIGKRVPAQKIAVKERIQLIKHLKASGVTLEQMSRITKIQDKTLKRWIRLYWDGDIPANRAVVDAFVRRARAAIKNTQKQLNILMEALELPLNYKEARFLVDKLLESEHTINNEIAKVGLAAFESDYAKYQDHFKKTEALGKPGSTIKPEAPAVNTEGPELDATKKLNETKDLPIIDSRGRRKFDWT